MIGECYLAHGANGAYGRLPKEKVFVCPECAWEGVTYINKDQRKALTEQESEAKAIMNGHAIDTCPRRRQAAYEIKKHAVNKTTMKVRRLTHSVFTTLKETFSTNPYHEDYRSIIMEAIDGLIKAKFFIQSRPAGEIHIAEDCAQDTK